jgi:DNA polymerase V
VPLFALVDCNNFYASCERVFNPAIRRKPVVVLSNNDGCVIARSNEAKALGFKMGDPYFKVKQQIAEHGVAVFSSNYTLYGDMSRRVVQTLEQLAPTVEVYSIDEAFLELSGFSDEAVPALAAHIRRTVRQWTGIPVSVGIGPTKTLAKAANRIAKQNADAEGVWSLTTPSSQHDALSQLPVGDVWGIGRQWAKLLEGQGITTALALSEQSDAWLKKHLNVVGQRTAWELRGIPCIPLELAPSPRKGIMVSRSFGRRLTEFEPVREALAAYVTRVAEKLRHERRHARQMMIFLHNSPFDAKEAYFSRQASFQLPHPTSDTAELIHHACQALASIFRPGIHYNKCGVMLTELTPDTVHQGDFLDTRDTARSQQLMTAVDAINRRMGRDTVFYAASGVKRDWAMARTMKSQHFTTDWQQLLQVGAVPARYACPIAY